MNVNVQFHIETLNKHIVFVEYYEKIKYFFFYEFNDMKHVLLYVNWIHIKVFNDAIINKNHWINEFIEIKELQYLMKKIKVKLRDFLNKIYMMKKIYNLMIKYLRNVLF